MKVISVKDIARKDVPLYYRRIFTALAVIDILDSVTEHRIDFIIETKPTGAKEISVTLQDAVDYPLVPLLRELKAAVQSLDREGALP